MAALRVQTAVVGAGVVGLAAARALAMTGRDVLLLEAEQQYGSGSSSRNSEVVHAGIYYAAGSLKARACVAGRRLLYDFCETHGVACRRVGKLIVATRDEEMGQLAEIEQKARSNGLVGADEALRLLSRAEVAEREPEVSCVGALLSPSTGIVDSHALMLALLGSAQRHGAELSVGSRAVGGRVLPSGRLLLQAECDGETLELECDEVVNSAGHGAPAVAAALGGVPADLVPAPRYAKGNYFGLVGRSPFRGLVYPVPQQAGLGVHATVDLAGRCRFGPDVQWTGRPDDYDVDPRRADGFYAEVRKYWPGLPDEALVPDYAGVRPKIQAEGEPARDFELLGPATHGVPGLVHLFGIESPGLTASLALAQLCVEALGAELDDGHSLPARIQPRIQQHLPKFLSI